MVRSHYVVRICTVGIAAAVLTVSAGPLHAGPIFQASANAASGTSERPGPTDTQVYSGASPGVFTARSLTDSWATHAALGQSASFASAQLGSVHAQSEAQADAFASVCCTVGTGHTSAWAAWQDAFVPMAAGVAAGTRGTLTADVLIHGDFSEAMSGRFWNVVGSWGASGRIGSTSWSAYLQRDVDWVNGVLETGTGSFGVLTLAADIVFGQANLFTLRVDTQAFASAGGFGGSSAFFESNLANTVSWLGITGMTADGLPVSGFSALSPDSGFDFVAPRGTTGAVPEPTALAMFGGGLVMLARRWRRS